MRCTKARRPSVCEPPLGVPANPPAGDPPVAKDEGNVGAENDDGADEADGEGACPAYSVGARKASTGAALATGGGAGAWLWKTGLSNAVIVSGGSGVAGACTCSRAMESTGGSIGGCGPPPKPPPWP